MDNGAQDVYTDPLFVGLTRPATMWGIPYIAFVIEFMATTLIFLAIGNPLYLLLLPVWLLRGKAHLKRAIATRATVDVASLPYDTRVLALVRDSAARPRVLCSASDQILVDAVAAHTGVFDAAIGSDGRTNRDGPRKAAALVERFGERGFDYVANGPHTVSITRPTA